MAIGIIVCKFTNGNMDMLHLKLFLSYFASYLFCLKKSFINAAQSSAINPLSTIVFG